MASERLQSTARRIAWEAQGVEFLGRNLVYGRRLRRMTGVERDGYVFSGLPSRSMGELNEIHALLRGSRLSWNRALLLRQFGDRFCGIVRTATNPHSIVGFHLYYFRKPEAADGVIHSAYKGIRPEFRGMGLSQSLSRFTISHLKRAGLNHISSQVDPDNTPSLRSALAIGFEVQDQGEVSPGSTGSRLQILLNLQSPQPPQSEADSRE